MLEAPNMFPDDPDAQQAFTDALPIIADWLNASARVPANSQAGRTMRAIGQQRAAEGYVQDLTEQLQLKADRIGIELDELLEHGQAAVKRGARTVGAPQPGRVTPPPAANANHGGRQLRENMAAALQTMVDARRAVTAAQVALKDKQERRDIAERAYADADRAYQVYEQGRVAA